MPDRDENLELLAKALADVTYGEYTPSVAEWENAPDDLKDTYRALAQAVLAHYGLKRAPAPGALGAYRDLLQRIAAAA